jgi:hypothetical protein
MGSMGPVGLDYAPLFKLAHALGYELHALAQFLPAVEAGMMHAFMQRMKKDEDGQS